MGRTYAVGLIGVGAFGQFLLRAYQQMPEVEVRAIAAAHPERARAVAQQFGIPRFYAPGEALLEDPEIEVVVIATPPDTHVAFACAAAERGKHFVCEKPLALSPEGAQQVIEAVQRSGVRASVNYVMRYMPVYERLRELIREAVLGKLVGWSFLNAAERPRQEWFFAPERSGGILLEHGVHFYDLAFWLVGEAFVPTATGGDGVTEAWSFGLFPSVGCHGLFWHSFRGAPHRGECQYLCVVGEEAIAIAEGWIPTVLRLRSRRGEEVLVHGLDAETLYRQAVQQVLRELLHWLEHPEEPPRVGLEDARRSVAVAWEAVRCRVTAEGFHPWSSSGVMGRTPS